MSDSTQDRTEKATPKREEEALREGNVAKSTEINSAAVLLAALLAFWLTGAEMGRAIRGFLAYTYQRSSFLQITPDSLPVQTELLVMVVLKLLGPFCVVLMAVAVLANYVQVGSVWATKGLKPKFSKINPMKGFKKFVSMRSLVELLKGLLKLTIVGLIGYNVLAGHIEDFPVLASLSVAESVGFLLKVTFELTIKIAIALVFLAAADFAYQKYDHAKQLKMTKQEVKDENKQTEGSPQVKSRIRSKQLEAARNRMFSAVPEATVVVTNPTHIAVALHYDPANSHDAPRVVAKGQRKIAERIKAIAREFFIPVVENKPLARSLYAACEVGQEIPEEFYQAVAEILSQIFQRDHDQYEAIRSRIHG